MLNIEKTALTQQPQQDKLLMVAQEKKMALCEICGSFLVANDAAERTQSHVTGKQHMGYGMVREFLSEYKVILLLCKSYFIRERGIEHCAKGFICILGSYNQNNFVTHL